MSGIEGASARERQHYRREAPPLRQPPTPTREVHLEREVVELEPVSITHRAGVRFTHVGHGFDHAEYATFGDAVAAARDAIREIDLCPGQFTRAFIALRQRSNTSDRELVRWEVFTDRVELDSPQTQPAAPPKKPPSPPKAPPDTSEPRERRRRPNRERPRPQK